MIRFPRISSVKKVFIAAGALVAVALCVYSFFSYWQESKDMASAADAKTVFVKIKSAASYKVGGKYSVSWESDCRGGEAVVWLTIAGSEKSGVGLLVPLTKFSGKNFGLAGKDERLNFSDPWKFNLSHADNKEKLAWTMPSSINLPRSYYGSKDGVFYIYTLADGSFTEHKIVKEPVEMPVLPGNYLIRVDIKGKSGCQATGFSQEIKVIK